MAKTPVVFPTNADGTLASYAWPGGYPIVYLDGQNSVLCAHCAQASLPSDLEEFRPAYADIHWEGEPLYCEECGQEIPSAYGPVEE